MRTVLPLLLLIVSIAGCKSGPAIGDEESDFELFPDGEYPDSIRLSNGTVNLIIVPSIGGRIMRYGYVGGPNLLWNNPDAEPPDHAATTAAARPANVNYGGDKAWPWPQDQWPLLIGRIYPPPPEADQQPYRSRRIGSLAVRLESPPIVSHRARIVREITLAPAGTRVTIVTRLEQASTDRPPPELAAWSITQVPGNARLYARMLYGGATRAMQPAWPATRPVGERVIALDPPTPRAGKLGLDADILAAVIGQSLFVQSSSTAAATQSTGYRRAERAQVFIQQADKPKHDVPRYQEMEFTSPRQDLASGRSPELRVTWEIAANATPWTDEAVAAYLRRDTPDPANLFPPPGVP